MEKLSFYHLARQMAIAILAVFALLCVCSCSSNDEPMPETSVDYYLGIQTTELIYRSGTIPPNPKEDMIGLLTQKMKRRIREAYPERNLKGNDAAVLTACDEVYREYLETGFKENTECVATLFRVKLSGIVVKQSAPIKNYYF